MLSDDFVSAYVGREPDWGFNGLGRVVYKRTYARPTDDGGTEEWWQTVRRVVEGAQAIGAGLDEDEERSLYDHMFHLRGLPAGRMLWQMGTPNNERLGGDSLVNCWFVDVARPSDLSWMFERLMLGGGVGFSVNGAGRLGIPAPSVVEHRPTDPDVDFIVPDNRAGWAQLIERVLALYLGGGGRLTYSTLAVRPAGAPISTFGGTASGPGILVDGVAAICGVLDRAAAEGRHLTSVDVLDVANIIGSIVVSGNVRRSAQIALGEPGDGDFLRAKRWDLGGVPNHRAMSNNSLYLDDPADLGPDFWDGYRGVGEPYGLFNLQASRRWGRTGEERPDPSIAGTNPCAEIGLADRESCNLAEVFLPRIRSAAELREVAGLLYKVQKAVAAMPYLDPVSDDVTSRNMRLGLGVTGLAQAGAERLSWLSDGYEYLRALDASWSRLRGWPESVRLTTVKPSGTLSLLAGVTPGVHPGFSRYHVRRVRMSSADPLVDWCRRSGYPVEPARGFDGEDDPATSVVEFPCEFPAGTVVAEDVGAIDQLRMQARAQRDWADNAVSVTVYYRPEELPAIQEHIAANWGTIKSVSFLPLQDHGFDQAPLEAIDEAEYRRRLAAVAAADGDLGDGELGLECDGGACPVR